MYRLAIAALLALATTWAGCASSNSWLNMSDAEFIRRVREYNQKVPRDQQIHCERVKPLGTHFYHWSCRWKWSMDAERMQTQDVMRRMQQVEAEGGH